MSSVEEIEAAIANLPRDAFWRLTDRLMERREAAWDAQLEADSKTGRLDALWARAESEIEAGEIESLDAFLGNE